MCVALTFENVYESAEIVLAKVGVVDPDNATPSTVTVESAYPVDGAKVNA